ncbi:MAG: sigma-54-dependent transcriptional regulator [Fidelibacterota bacterium]
MAQLLLKVKQEMEPRSEWNFRRTEVTGTNDITVLVIEDDSTMSEGIQTVLKKDGYRVLAASDGVEGSKLFQEEHPDLVITDLKLPGKGGMHLLGEFQATDSKVPVILISAYGTIDLAVSALKSGAKDFIAKPFSIDELRKKVAQTVKDLPFAASPQAAVPAFHGMVGSSPEMKAVYEQIGQIARVHSPVLITGESGTGKELIARAIHSESSRGKKQFLAVNCGAFTDNLLASELFGHEKGSFTGAVRQHKGIFEQANGGTILLDEIGEISPQMQVKLLRVLQDQSFQRVGGSAEISTDVRIISATNRDLKESVKKREFREDLYFRLNVVPLAVPPLRQRASDIPELVDHILVAKCRALGRKKPVIHDDALSVLGRYFWPGNIRELENFLERILIFSDRGVINADDIYLDEHEEPVSDISGQLTDVLEETEYRMIRKALRKAGGVKQKAARLLGIKTSTLYYKMEKYGLLHDSAGNRE